MAAAVTAPAASVRSRTAPAAFLRLGAFVPLALYGGLHWARLLDPAPGFAAFAMVLGSTAAGALLIAVQRLRSRPGRVAALAGIVLGLLFLSFVAAGVPLRLMLPDAWGDLSAGIGQGLQAMPGVAVPYRGIDGWIRSAIMIGGTLLIGLAAVLAFWPTRRADGDEQGHVGFPFSAAVALGVLYGVPIVERGPRRPYLDGAVFCLLLAAFLWLERLRLDQLGVAAGALGLSVLAGAIVAPHIDGSRPWFNYEHFAETLQPAVSEQFSWDHTYGPLRWPQDGRELLRVKARDGTYWKAETLDQFDGYRWRYSGSFPPVEQDTELPRGHSRWYQTITVIDRDLKSNEFIGAGTTLGILPPAPHNPVLEAPGMFVTSGAPLTRGDSYRAQVYTPDPSELQLRTDRASYPDFAKDYIDVDLPRSVGGPPPVNPYTHTGAPGTVTEVFDPFVAGGPSAPPELVYPDGSVAQDVGDRAILASAYGRVYKLAQQLRAHSSSAYDFVVAVQSRVQQGATYSQTPPQHRYPLVSFLFGDRLGYCQQFSGAMALLLRMGGVPARVASGFTMGSLDRTRDEYVVRDLDAHSWVEAYFPRYGWIRFDPTPAAAPARSGASASSSSQAPAGSRAPHQPGDRPSDIHGPGVRPVGGGGGMSPWLIVGLVALLGAGVAGVVVLNRRGRLPGEPLSPELAELQTALHRSGRPPSPEVTLAELEELLGGTDAASGYVRALRDRRYGNGGRGPTPRQRAGLRYELGAGLGIGGRLRAFWALPPRPREWRWLVGRPV